MDPFQGGEDEEVLLASEQLAYAITTSQEKSSRLHRSIESYQTLISTLEHIHSHTRVPMMVPVANGLGYFEGELRHTNDVTALLGDNWFAERTVAQAGEICHRRLTFLTKEKEQVAQELVELEKKQQLLETEFQRSATASSTSSSSKLKSSTKATTTRQSAPAVAAELQDVSNNSTKHHVEEQEVKNDEGDAESDEGEDDNNEGIPDFHPDDELTDEELEALEKSIDPKLLNDDEYVEKLMLDMMIAKRAARLGFATAAVFGEDDEGTHVVVGEDDDDHPHTAPQSQVRNNTQSLPADVVAAVPTPTAYRSPADIGPRPTSAPASTNQTSQHRTSSYQGSETPMRAATTEAETKPRRNVTFENAVVEKDIQQQSTNRSTTAATTTAFLRNTMMQQQQQQHSVAAEDDNNEFSFEDEFGRRVAVPGLMTQQAAAAGTQSAVGERRPVSAPSFSPLGSVAERPQRAAVGAAAPGAGGAVAGRSLFMQRMLGEGR